MAEDERTVEALARVIAERDERIRELEYQNKRLRELIAPVREQIAPLRAALFRLEEDLDGIND